MLKKLFWHRNHQNSILLNLKVLTQKGVLQISDILISGRYLMDPLKLWLEINKLEKFVGCIVRVDLPLLLIIHGWWFFVIFTWPEETGPQASLLSQSDLRFYKGLELRPEMYVKVLTDSKLKVNINSINTHTRVQHHTWITYTTVVL